MGGLAVWVIYTPMDERFCSTGCVSVAVNLCQGVQGYIQTGEEGYLITPAGGAGLESQHELVRLGGGREKRNTPSQAGGSGRRNNLTGDEDMFTWYDVDLDVDLDSEMAQQDEQFSDIEWEGYVADKVWQVEQILSSSQYLVDICCSNSWTRLLHGDVMGRRRARPSVTDPTVNISGQLEAGENINMSSSSN